MPQTKGAGIDHGTSGEHLEKQAGNESAMQCEEEAGSDADDGVALSVANVDAAAQLSNSYLKTLQRDLCMLSEVVRRNLEQVPLETAPGASVTVDQMRALRFVTQNPGLSVGVISDGLGIRPSSTSAAVDRLEIKGLVVREMGSADQRNVFVESTAEGKELVREVQSQIESKLTSTLGRMQEDDIAFLPERLRMLTEALMEEAVFAGPCHYCAPGYADRCVIQHLFRNCPHVESGNSSST